MGFDALVDHLERLDAPTDFDRSRAPVALLRDDVVQPVANGGAEFTSLIPPIALPEADALGGWYKLRSTTASRRLMKEPRRLRTRARFFRNSAQDFAVATSSAPVSASMAASRFRDS